MLYSIIRPTGLLTPSRIFYKLQQAYGFILSTNASFYLKLCDLATLCIHMQVPSCDCLSHKTHDARQHPLTKTTTTLSPRHIHSSPTTQTVDSACEGDSGQATWNLQGRSNFPCSLRDKLLQAYEGGHASTTCNRITSIALHRKKSFCAIPAFLQHICHTSFPNDWLFMHSSQSISFSTKFSCDCYPSVPCTTC